MHLGFALEYSLGHVTHATNLKGVLAADRSVTPSYVDLPYHNTPGAWARLPGVRSNWSVRASLGAYLGLRRLAGSLSGVLFHTQVTSLFSGALMRRVPSVVSLDATPLQYDQLGASYGHARGNARLEALKKRMNERAFRGARHLVTWSRWAKDSLVNDYHVPAGKITVIPPGIDLKRWSFRRTEHSREVNVLFVGADFQRKGGDTLIQAFRQLPQSLPVQLHVVTREENIPGDLRNLAVHRGLTPNSPLLMQLYAAADLFVFPTRGDCLPLAVLEACAAGLPIITTSVGALPEAVSHGVTGWIVPPDDPQKLAEVITALANDAPLRRRLGEAALETAVTRYCGKTNYEKLVRVVKESAAEYLPRNHPFS